MKVSLKWLQTYFDSSLPSAAELSDALTFHAFEIEEASGTMLDVKVLPNRAADCLSHRGIAKELAAILGLPLKTDPLRTPLESRDFVTPSIKVEIEDSAACGRYMGAVVQGVKVGPSPDWLREALEAVGQRSINNVVDATNYVMLNIGQPLHAFDAAKLTQQDTVYAISVRGARAGEKITTLTGDEYTLSPSISLITDANSDTPIALAGIKGGKAAEVTSETTTLVVESANFDGTVTRRAAQALKLWTDASTRFQNRPSRELVAYGMRDVLALITEIAGGEVIGITDEYPARAEGMKVVEVTLERVNGLLGSHLTPDEVAAVFVRLGLEHTVSGTTVKVTPPFERTDLTIPEDLIEEVGRIVGYDTLVPLELPPLTEEPNQRRYAGIERMKDQLIAEGYSEVSTQSFAKSGDVELQNPLDKAKPALRTSLEENLVEALTKAAYVAPLVLEPKQKPKLFEVGTVFPKEGEHLELRMSEKVPAWGDTPTHDNLSVAKLEEYGAGYEPVRVSLGAFKPYSAYPFITRDIAFWAPAGADDGVPNSIMRKEAGELLVRIDQFDRFEKEERVSLAYRLVFQSFDRTLTDEEVNTAMERVAKGLAGEGFEVR